MISRTAQPGPGGAYGIVGPGGSAGMLHPSLAPLLAAIQEARLFADSKAGVDLGLRSSVADTAAAAQQLLARGPPSKAQLQVFLDEHLTPPGGELEEVLPSDWQEGGPAGFMSHLEGRGEEGQRLRRFAQAVHVRWRMLCRKARAEVAVAPERSSLLPVHAEFCIPGDRFRELYYWDSYWVIRGLLVSGMQRTAAAMVGNLLGLVEGVGHVPNGARVYYLNRSQPPLLSAMVRAVYEATQDPGLLRRALPALVKEHAYWTAAPKAVAVRDASGAMHQLSRYYADLCGPRPESCREDAETALQSVGTSDPSDPAARQLYLDLASAAESGWDFSSRWFADGASLGTIRTTQVVPADLNAFLFQSERNVAWAAQLLGDAATAERFEEGAAARQRAMDALLWDDATGCWRDGLLAEAAAASGEGATRLLHLNSACLASNYVPLWAGLTEGDAGRGVRVSASLAASQLVQPAGVATTLAATGQQWDWPNGWPPLQHMLVEGLHRHGGTQGQQLAVRLAHAWVQANVAAFEATGHMHEKYDVRATGAVGGGGEYEPQVGFGWSNGVALDFLARYF